MRAAIEVAKPWALPAPMKAAGLPESAASRQRLSPPGPLPQQQGAALSLTLLWQGIGGTFLTPQMVSPSGCQPSGKEPPQNSNYRGMQRETATSQREGTAPCSHEPERQQGAYAPGRQNCAAPLHATTGQCCSRP
jgi:hypothetical protein